MKNSKIVSIDALHSSIKSAIKGQSSTDAYGKESLTFHGDFGNGLMTFNDFEKGMSVVEIDGLFFEDTTFTLQNKDSNLYHFFYLTNGHCFQNFKGIDSYQKIELFSPTVVGCNPSTEGQLVFKKDIGVNLTIITIDISLYLENYEERFSVPKEDYVKLTDIFSALRNYMYECAPKLKISEDLESIRDGLNYSSVTYKYSLQNRYHLVLNDYINQLYTEFYEDRVVVDLTRTELQKVKEITDYINENPGTDLSLDKLCSMVIMSQSKLQKGFKCVHNTTVSNYIRDVRLEKAKNLLLNSDLNVSEIVYSVGFTSRSYFCKIFKQKYKANPTSYREKYKDPSINADLLIMD